MKAMARPLRHLAQGCVESRTSRATALVVAALVTLAVTGPALAQVQPKYLYTLANFEGRLPYDWARIHVDQERDETYVIYQNLIRIFGPSGMEVFSFGDDLDLGRIVDAVVDGQGDIILLSHVDGRPLVTRCDFRGVPIGPVDIVGLPAEVPFEPNRVVHRNGLLYFVSGGLRVVVTDSSGGVREHIDLLPLLELDEKQRSDVELIGFAVDADGNIWFTVPVHFKVYRLAADRALTSFGRAGAAPGRFGIVAGVVTDSRGHVLVADKLRCVILVFDRDLNFLTEFGYRGSQPENLIVPDDLAIDTQDRVYVTQGRRRGVSVFALAGG